MELCLIKVSVPQDCKSSGASIISKFEETKNIIAKIVFNSYIIISLVLLFYSAHYKRESNRKLNVTTDNVWNIKPDINRI